MSDDKIIPFPSGKVSNVNKTGPTGSVDDVVKIREQQTKEFVETAVDDIAMMLLRNFVDLAMKTDKANFTRDLALLIDMLRGMIYRDFNVEHPAQRLSDEIVSLNYSKSGDPTAKIDYSKIVSNTKQSRKPLSKEFKKELKDVQESAGFFEPDGELDD